MLDIIPDWFPLVVDLGVPIAKAKAYREDNPSHIGGLYALRDWRDGKYNEAKFPPTWEFLLKTVDTTCGSQVAKQLEAIARPVQTQLFGPHDGGNMLMSSDLGVSVTVKTKNKLIRIKFCSLNLHFITLRYSRLHQGKSLWY